ncbi:MAG: DNA polymerase III subunit gamma/tau [Terriglobales bacterium]|jgi:DNA polymerase-3 subunit gamma/tau
MSYQVLARKYRPQKFSDVIGQEHVTRTLQNAIEQQRIAHGYIFSGHRGIGKTTIARILAMALNCRGTDGKADKPQAEPCGVCDSCTEIRAGGAVDVIEIDAATNRGIDEIRELRDAARYRPARDRYKIYILDEAHQITDAAFNALLKTLEEPPGHVVFMMATTAPEDIPQTIRSRCQHFSFHAVRFDDIVGQLRDIAKKEKIKADDDALALLAEAGDGSMRDALSIMDQAIACCGEKLTAEIVRGLVGAVPSETLEQMMVAVEKNSSEEILRQLDRLLVEGQNPTHLARQMVRFIRNAMVAKVAGNDSPLLQISSDERARVGRVAALFSEEDLTRFLNILLRTHGDVSYKQDQRFHLELGLLKMVHAQRLLPVEQILSGVELPKSSATPSRSAAPARASEPPRAAASYTREAPAVSPFEMDRNRKSREPQMSAEPAQLGPSLVVQGATAAVMAPEPQGSEESELSIGEIQARVVGALEEAGFPSVASLLDGGEWSLAGSEIVIKVTASPTVVEMVVNAEAKRVATTSATAAARRAIKLKIIGGAAVNGSALPSPRIQSAPAGSARQRAAEDPIVRRMQEKFNAEIRTVIDKRQP